MFSWNESNLHGQDSIISEGERNDRPMGGHCVRLQRWHAVHITLLNCENDFRRWFIQNGHTIVGFLPCEMISVKKENDENIN